MGPEESRYVELGGSTTLSCWAFFFPLYFFGVFCVLVLAGGDDDDAMGPGMVLPVLR